MPVYLDIRILPNLHPTLPAPTGADYCHRAALALDRRGHEPNVALTIQLESTPSVAVLDWDRAACSDALQLDNRRITEDGAEAVALIVAAMINSWVIERRLQQGESADWLLRDSNNQLIALEISGIDGPYDGRRMNEKLRQVLRATVTPARYACVVAFGPPSTVLKRA